MRIEFRKYSKTDRLDEAALSEEEFDSYEDYASDNEMKYFEDPYIASEDLYAYTDSVDVVDGEGEYIFFNQAQQYMGSICIEQDIAIPGQYALKWLFVEEQFRTESYRKSQCLFESPHLGLQLFGHVMKYIISLHGGLNISPIYTAVSFYKNVLNKNFPHCRIEQGVENMFSVYAPVIKVSAQSSP